MTAKQTSNGSKPSTQQKTQETTASPSIQVTSLKGSSTQLKSQISSFDLEIQNKGSLSPIEILVDSLADVETDEERAELYQSIQDYLSQSEQFIQDADRMLHLRQKYISLANSRKQEAKRLNALASAAQHKADQIEERVLDVMGKLHPDETKYSFPSFEMKSKIVSNVIDIDYLDVDMEEIPLDCQEVSVSIKKTAIKTHIKNGAHFKGVTMSSSRKYRFEWRMTF